MVSGLGNVTFSLLKSLGYTSAAPIKFKIGLFFHEWKDLFSFGFGIILLRLNNYASDNGVILLLGKVLPVDLLGLFERCYRIVMLPGGYLNKVLNQVLFPTMSEIQNEDDKLFFFYQRSLGLVNSIMIPVAIFLIFFSPEIIHILLGSAWFTAIVPLQILFVILPLRISVQMGDAVIKAKGLLYRNAWRKLWYVLFLLLCVGIGGWYYGVKGAAGGVVAGMLFNYVTMLFLVKNIFTKKVSKIIFDPLWAGLKLGLPLLAILFLISYIFGLFGKISIVFFIVALFAIVVFSIMVVIYKPEWLGKYIGEASQKIMPFVKDKFTQNSSSE